MQVQKLLENLIVLFLPLIPIGTSFAMPPDPTLFHDQPAEEIQKGAENEKRSAALSMQSRALTTVGDWNALAILIECSDQSMVKSLQEFQELLFGSPPTGSVREFYEENSYGLFHLDGITVGIYRAEKSCSYYADNNYGFGSYPKNASRLAEEAIDAAASSVNFSQFDNDGDGMAESIFVIHSGRGAEQTGKRSHIWSHRGYLTNKRSYDGVQIDSYVMGPELSGTNKIATIGVFAHEFGHILGLPDLYDLDGTSNGIGRFGAMSYGAWNNGGITPAHFTSWAKAKLGWLEPEAVTADRIEEAIPPAAEEPVAYKVSVSSTEYFMIENRQRIGFDLALPAEGLLVFHIDETQTDNKNECITTTCNSNYLVSLVQADRQYDLELKRNYGDSTDPFTSGSTTLIAYNGSAVPMGIKNILQDEEWIVADLKISTAPFIFSDPPARGRPGEPYQYTPQASSPLSLSWNLSQGPSGMTIDPDTGTVYWDHPERGDYLVKITAINSEGESVSQEWLLTIRETSLAPADSQESAGGCSIASIGSMKSQQENALFNLLILLLPTLPILIRRQRVRIRYR